MSMSLILGSLTRPYKARFLYEVIDSRPKWDTRFNVGLHNDCLSEIFSGKKNNIVSLNSRTIAPYQAPFFSFSESSNVACGTYLVLALRKFPPHMESM